MPATASRSSTAASSSSRARRPRGCRDRTTNARARHSMIMRSPLSRDFASGLTAVLVVGALGWGAFLIVRPFLAAAIWAVMIVVVTWQPMLDLQRRLWNSRALAVAVMLVLVMLLFLLPLLLVIGTVLSNAGDVAAEARALGPLA